MKKVGLIGLCTLIVCCSYADEFEKSYGQGVIHVAPDTNSYIEFTSGPDSIVTHRLIWKTTTSQPYGGFEFDGVDTIPDWFQTLFMKMDGEYHRIDIIGRDSSANFYRTMLLDRSGKEVWIRKKGNVQFLTWFGFYCTMASIELESGEVILYSQPKAKAKRVNYSRVYPGEEQFNMRPLETRKFWMKVEIQVPDADPLQPWHIHTGWIKWRDENKPLIDYNLMGC